jgi:quinol monooxygenase YgiN
MQVVVIRFTVREAWVDRWLDLVAEFTRSTRAEAGNLWFWWARSVDEPGVFFLLEGHREDSVEQHLKSPLIPKIQREWPAALVETPRVLMTIMPGDDWQEMALLPVPAR